MGEKKQNNKTFLLSSFIIYWFSIFIYSICLIQLLQLLFFGLVFGFDSFSCLNEVRYSPCYFPSPFGHSLCLFICKIVILDRFSEILKHI